MLGIALLAVALAESRTYEGLASGCTGDWWGPVNREVAHEYAASNEYYRIIDRISRGETP